MNIQDPLAIYCYLSMFYDYTLSSPELSKLWQVSVRLGTGSDLLEGSDKLVSRRVRS